MKAEEKKIIEQSIKNLQYKHDTFLGTEGEKSRRDFKLGLSWGIDSIETALREIELLNK